MRRGCSGRPRVRPGRGPVPVPTCEISTSQIRKVSSTCSAASSCDTVQGTMFCERLRCKAGRHRQSQSRPGPAPPPAAPARPTCFFSAWPPAGEPNPPGDCV